MDTFVDCAWYYMRYCDPHIDERDGRRRQRLLDADGPVHRRHRARDPAPAVRALLDQGDARPRSWSTFDEPFTRLFTQGMVLNESTTATTRRARRRWYFPTDEVDDRATTTRAGRSARALRDDGQPVSYGGIEKMSKSKNNGVEPQDLIDRYGADTARLFIDVRRRRREQTLEWTDAGVEGAYRFLRRLWTFAAQARRRDRRGAGARPRRAAPAQGAAPRGPLGAAPGQLRLRAAAVQHRRLGRDEAAQRARGARRLAGSRSRRRRCARASASCCACSTRPARTPPRRCGTSSAIAAEHGDLLDAPWPQVDEAALVQDEIELVLQVNGKLRGAITVPPTPTRRRSRRPRWRARSSRSSPRAGREEGRSSCRAGSSTSSSDATRRRTVRRRLRSRRALAGCGFELRARARAALSRPIAAGRLRAALAARRRAAHAASTRARRRRSSTARRRRQVVLRGARRRAREERRRASTAAGQVREFAAARALRASALRTRGRQGADPADRDRAAAAT